MRDVEDENIWMEEKMNLVSFRFRPFCEKKRQTDSQVPRIDLNKRFLPKPNTTTA